MINNTEEKVKQVTKDLIRESFGRVVYSQTTHDYDISGNISRLICLKWINVILTGLTFGGILSTIVIDEQWLKLIIAIVSSVTLSVSTYQLSFNPEQEISAHRGASKELWSIRERYKNLLGDIEKGSLSDDQATKKRDEFLSELTLIYRFAPKTSSKAYLKAQKALQKEEEQTFKKGEIDNFLPKSLREKRDT